MSAKMDTKAERYLILKRVLHSLRIIARSEDGISIRELRKRLSTIGPQLQFTEQTIRRDCRVYEHQDLIRMVGSRAMTGASLSRWIKSATEGRLPLPRDSRKA